MSELRGPIVRQREGKLSPKTVAALVGDLTQHFGNKISTSEAVRVQHGHTLTWTPNAPPDAVLYAESRDDVIDAVKICAKHDAPIVPFGAGSSLEGHVNALHGGVVDRPSRAWTACIAVHAEDLDCVVEPGVTRKTLNAHLRDSGLFFPIDPGADATIGGMAATRASGTNAVRYGTMKDNVISLGVVTADGSFVRTAEPGEKIFGGLRSDAAVRRLRGHARRHHRDYAETRRHSRGDLGRTLPVPRCARGVLTDDRDDPNPGIPVARIELLDALQVKACNAYSKLGLPETPMLFVEFHGSEDSVAEQSRRFDEIADEYGGGPFAWTTNPEERTQAVAGAP